MRNPIWANPIWDLHFLRTDGGKCVEVFTKEYEQLLSHLIEARKRAGLTQSDLAVRLGRLQTFVSKL